MRQGDVGFEMFFISSGVAEAVDVRLLFSFYSESIANSIDCFRIAGRCFHECHKEVFLEK